METAASLVRKRWTLSVRKNLLPVLEGGGRGVYIRPQFFDLGMEFDVAERQHCSCSSFSHHMGGRLPGVLFCKKQNGPDREEQRSDVACLCHARQTCNLPCSWPCHLCVCQSRSNKCGEFHRDPGGISTTVLWTASVESS